MGSTAANGLITNLNNYQGEWVAADQKKYPFATLLGLARMSAGEENPFRNVGDMKFDMSQSYTLDAASQPAITENQTFNAPTSNVYATTQNLNYCQVFREGVKLSDLKQSSQRLAGHVINGQAAQLNDMQKQIMVHIEQMKRDFEYSIINGSGQDGSSDSDTAFKIGGLYTDLSSNKVNANGNPISKDLIEKQLVVSMADNGSDMRNMYFMADAYLITAINELYGVQPRAVNIGGINLLQLVIPIMGTVNLVYNDLVPSGVLLAVDLDRCEGVSNTTPGEAQISLRSPANAGQGDIKEVFAKIGLDYTHESKHGAIYGLATS